MDTWLQLQLLLPLYYSDYQAQVPAHGDQLLPLLPRPCRPHHPCPRYKVSRI